MVKRFLILPIFILGLIFSPAFSFAGSKGLRVTNEMIYEKLLEIEKRQAVLEAEFKEFKESTNKRFEDMNKRFEELRADTNRRFEELREDMNRRFDEQMNFMEIMVGVFTALVVAIIGFALWDRRTIIRKAKEETIEELVERGVIRKLLEALRELAKEDVKVARVLRHFGLL